MHNFDFAKRSSIAEAAKLLGQEGAQALSGGPDFNAHHEATA